MSGERKNTMHIPLPLCSSARRRPAHCREAPANMSRLRGREYVCLELAIAPADVQQIPFSVFCCVTWRVTEGIASLEKQIKDSNTVKQDSTALTPPVSLTLSPLRYMVVCAYASFMVARSAMYSSFSAAAGEPFRLSCAIHRTGSHKGDLLSIQTRPLSSTRPKPSSATWRPPTRYKGSALPARPSRV